MISYYDDGKIEVAILEQAKPGKTCCGDAHTVIHTEDYTVCAVADGLGSGEGALQSAKAAIETIEMNHHATVEEMMEACNESLLFMRGAVMTIIKVDYVQSEICYSNVGNIGFIFHFPDGKTIQPIPSRGYLSGKKQTIKSQCFKYQKGSAFLLFSDGIQNPPPKHLLLKMASPKKVANELFPADGYAIDDVTLLVGKL
ncbi:protein phosphatase 2C domain-containing protein [Halalkalibacter oceani]|uniref:Protein phosphatase 2C domain-containing protein n=1 Tax=Halalkalibacter oceani TaxID=1653776 RepID=A0A9X2IPB8_9BACI|nr:protein phosphatase 2C domain-containing protein [Halalkalibacter oceani]MCM3714666.1 protein phosphatase 2C domain-containing protein [Halalkalibacter oceani]